MIAVPGVAHARPDSTAAGTRPERQMQQRPPGPPLRWSSRKLLDAGTSVRAGVDDFDAAILRPCRFVMAAINRTLFTVADDIELAHRCTGRAHGALHGIATTLAEAEVVLTGAALVGMAFEGHAGVRELTQVFGMAGNLRAEFRLDLGTVEIEVDDALAQAGIGIEIADLVTAGVTGGLGVGDRRLIDRSFSLDGLLGAGGDAGDKHYGDENTSCVVHW